MPADKKENQWTLILKHSQVDNKPGAPLNWYRGVEAFTSLYTCVSHTVMRYRTVRTRQTVSLLSCDSRQKSYVHRIPYILSINLTLMPTFKLHKTHLIGIQLLL
jgi:hypothetical protein